MLSFAHRFALELNAVRVVHEAVEDGVGERRIAHQLVPAIDRELAGDEGRSPFVAVFEDLEQVATLLVRDYAVTNAAVHDSQVFDELLDQTTDEDGHKRAVYADSAYRSEAREERLAANNLPSRICEKGKRGQPLTDTQKAAKRLKSTVRVRVEHVFGAQAQMGGHLVRTIGLARAVQDRDDESGVQHEALEATAQT